MPGDDGYPTEEEIERIASWQIKDQDDLDALWAFCRELWEYPDRFALWPEDAEKSWWTEGADWSVSTGGWSGNEDIIGALQRNYIFWALCFVVHRAGGHYGFRVENRINEQDVS